MKRHILRRMAMTALAAASALALAGCVEIGPGGIEAKIGIASGTKQFDVTALLDCFAPLAVTSSLPTPPAPSRR